MSETEQDQDPYAQYEDDEDVGLSEDEKKYGKSKQTDWFKGDKGRTYRVALVYFHTVDLVSVRALRAKAKKDGTTVDREKIQAIAKAALSKRAEKLSKSVDELEPAEKLDLGQVRFKKWEAHYKDGLGYFLTRKGKDGDDADRVWGMLDDPRTYFSTALLIYPTDNDGELDKTNLAKGWRIMPWRFSGKVYERIWKLNDGLKKNDLSIANQDLVMTCKNADFQNFDIDPHGKAVWRQSEKFQKKILEKAVTLFEKQLSPFRELSTADLKIKLGISTGGGEEVSEDDMSELLDSV